MEDRPWSPGPWKFDRGFFNPNQTNRIYLISPEEATANKKLASKSPEFAELAIRLTTKPLLRVTDGNLAADELWKIVNEFRNLLAEVGYKED